MINIKKSMLALSTLIACANQSIATPNYPAESFDPPALAQHFSKVRFSDPHVRVRLIDSYDCKDTFRVIFGKPEHLQTLMDNPVYIVAHKTYYVYEPDREELGFSNNATKRPAVAVIGPNNLNVMGALTLPEGHGIIFPSQAVIESISLSKAFQSNYSFKSNAKDLKAISELAFNLPAKQQRINQLMDDATQLMAMIRKDERKNPKGPKQFARLFPEVGVFCDETLNVKMTQILHSQKRMIAFAQTQENMKEAKKSFALSSHLRLLHPQAEGFGIYTPSPIFPIEYHHIGTPGNILLTGEYYHHNSKFKLQSGGDLWIIGLSLETKYSVAIRSGKSIFGTGLSLSLIQENMDRIPTILLQGILQHMVYKGMILPRMADDIFKAKLSRSNN